MISIVVPCFNEQEVLECFYRETVKVLEDLEHTYELIFVNDGSSDNTMGILRKLAAQNPAVHYISFSRNFGKEAAMLAGLNYSSGDAVVILDADLQHPPGLIPRLVKHFENGYDQVIAKRNRKGESLIRSSVSRLYYKLMNRFVDINLEDGVGDFRLLSRKAVNAILSLREYNRFSKGLFSWIGFKEYVIYYDNVNRKAGQTKWAFSKLLNYGIDGVISFNNKPLRMSIYMGLTITLLGILYVLFTFIKIMINGIDQPGYFTIISSILLIGGIQLIFLGVIGEYIGRIYYESKQRPHYIVEEESFSKSHMEMMEQTLQHQIVK
ncbi:glycosyltransferase family 2 protein [Thermoactinomyces mirandus]|uniref:Glycosyltransferase family 2 protein n=1 Tax=Thermoactinomyces mirandus TaxID=2756294 RepID=A0A7W2ASC5_9BACL|nr:glycosyltransferase family 2 protein [Thermoactinomyces mirandus]MBA4603919.1 glycosyltransferase family 2 protein [Thermoactinomyces mirandus]